MNNRFVWDIEDIETIEDDQEVEKTLNVHSGKKIEFHFHPFDYKNKGHVLIKADDTGQKRQYLAGISSGLKVDAHGERMSEKCIKSFMDQSNRGDILLYADIHGISESQDIGLLTKAEILSSGDWYTEYRLYDKTDGIGSHKQETIDTLWKQINGLPPYSRPRQKGFSIEGIIPDESIVYNDGNIARGVIDGVNLDGVVLVPRPAYTDSIATAICKAFGETSPERIKSIQTTLRDNVERQEVENKYYRLKWEYQDALETMVEKIILKNNNNKAEELDIIFEEYKSLMINLIMQSERMFAKEPDVAEGNILIVDQTDPYGLIGKGNISPKLDLYKSLLIELQNFDNLLGGKT